jgi:hypothetical protein
MYMPSDGNEPELLAADQAGTLRALLGCRQIMISVGDIP